MANEENPITEAVEMVKAYARQETIDPLKRLGPYLKFGVPGGVAAALGFFFLNLGVLRFMQRRGSWVTGNLSWVPYLVTVLFTIVLCAVFAEMIKRSGK
ncbi:MAG: hypothetical protein ACR2QE_20585 [Acidimicrobiales bacterium]